MVENIEEITLKVNGVEHACRADITVYQLLQKIGIEVPTFCYHPKLTVAGNCRMCLVDVKALAKPVASCAMQVRQDMDIWTDNEKVRKARTGVLELMLINHPLDCPICDQGGECDLQDVAMSYGSGVGRFQENKRAVPAKDFGPLIKTEMTRCIHCMRCVRFGKEIAGLPELGGLNRGENSEITTILGKAVSTELSGNMIDICPVGALTSKPTAFQGRAWEFQHTDSVDVHDAVGSHIRIDVRGNEVMRVVPRPNDFINEDWISDKTRFAFDGLKRQRLDRPYVRENGRLVPATWTVALEKTQKALKTAKADEIGALVGHMVGAESIFSLKKLMDGLGVKAVDCRQQEEFLPTKARSDYLFNTSIVGIEEADACLILGANPRYEASMVNVRLRKAYLHNNLNVAYVGPEVDLTYPYDHLGVDFKILEDILAGTHPYAAVLKRAKKPMIILGQAVMQHAKGEALYEKTRQISEKYKLVQKNWNGFNLLPLAASRQGALDLGFYPKSGKSLVKQLDAEKIKVLYVLAADEIDPALLKDVFVIYQGHHGDALAQHADVILPGAAYPECEGTYVNLEGRVQQSFQAMFPLGEAKEDWKIIQDVSGILKAPLGYQSLAELRDDMAAEVPTFKTLFSLPKREAAETSYKEAALKTRITVTLPVSNFYMTDAITRASVTMAKCVEAFETIDLKRTGTDG